MSNQIKVRADASAPGSKPVQLSPNASEPTHIKSASFEGDVLVRIKNFSGESGDGQPKPQPEDGYFADDGERRSKTWSIFVRGRFLEEVNGDDVMFGNTFEKPIRDSLPWGTSVATKFMRYIDPSLQVDFYADKPWALSPLLSSIPYLSVTPLKEPSLPTWSKDSLKPLKETTVDSFLASLSNSSADEALVKEVRGYKDQGTWDTAKRRQWLSSEHHRKALTLGPSDLIEMDFAQGYIDFSDLSVGIPTVGFHIKLKDYWDGQPVTFVCRNRDGSKVHFSVQFQIIDETVNPTGKKQEPAPAAEEINDEVD